RELQDRRPGVRQRRQHPDRVLRPAAQLVRVAAVQLLLSSMGAWESMAGFGPPFFLARSPGKQSAPGTPRRREDLRSRVRFAYPGYVVGDSRRGGYARSLTGERAWTTA